MSNKKLDALKALFKKEKENKTEGGNKKRGDMYPFWQMDMNKKAVVRLLPDKNPENPYQFFIDKLEHTLSINGKDEKVACLQMYGEKCPICDLSRDFYKTEGKGSANGKYYYRKKTSLLRVLVVEDPLPADEETGETAEGKVLNTQFGYQLMEKIKEEIGSDELETLPWDMDEGYNFIIKKTPQGEYGTYAVGSGFARRPTPVDPEIVDSIELIDLQTLLPKNPGYEFIKRKLDAHLNGTEDDGEGEEDGGEDEAPKKPAKPAPAKPSPAKPSKIQEAEEEDEDTDDEDEEEDEDDTPPAKPSKAPAKKPVVPDADEDDEEDILAQIRRNRKK